jgi:hypothetical protein
MSLGMTILAISRRLRAPWVVRRFSNLRARLLVQAPFRVLLLQQQLHHPRLLGLPLRRAPPSVLLRMMMTMGLLRLQAV